MSQDKQSNRGRRKGDFSFVTVNGSALSAFPNVVISRKWAAAVGLVVESPARNSVETLRGTPAESVSETLPALTAEVEA